MHGKLSSWSMIAAFVLAALWAAMPLASPASATSSAGGTPVQVSEISAALGTGAYFVNAASGKCLDRYNNDGHNGARVQQWNCEDQDAAYWDLYEKYIDGNPYYYFASRSHPGKCLEIANYATHNGAKAQIWDCVNQASAYWKAIPANHNGVAYIAFVNYYSNKCLEIAGASSVDGAIAQQWDCAGQPNAMWAGYVKG
ncbi:RICIN domain-containing protein [Amycolatopsis sp. NPDC051071]|uniref:RICIN domain-containing protein n=1 Tax=Amycolatopsis sp. NPDC051071 TaxID=3154637 RepID=UPI0034293F81